MGCLSSFAKYILFIFNFLIVLCGIALIAVGAIILANENKGIRSFTDFSVGGFAVAVGVIIFAIAFFGCCGAIKQNSCLLTTYAIILIVLLIIQVVLAALAFVSLRNDNNELDNKVRDAVKEVFENYVKDPQNKDKKEVVDNIQQAFECCGVDNSSFWDNNHISIPESCYKDNNKSQSLFTEGCARSFKDFITSNIKIIGAIAIAFAVVELLGAIFACMVRNKN